MGQERFSFLCLDSGRDSASPLPPRHDIMGLNHILSGVAILFSGRQADMTTVCSRPLCNPSTVQAFVFWFQPEN